jgi:signal recognition particle subunit SRP54
MAPNGVHGQNLEEKENPELLEKNPSRITRIAEGAGVNKSDVKALLKQYNMISTMIKEQASMDLSKGMSPAQMQKFMKKFAKKKFMKF